MMLATRILQQGEAGRPWLVWLHGLLGNNNEWRVIAARCPEWPSLAIDLPGHGDSVAVGCRGFDDISAQIAATLQLRNIERYWLVGYSLGGRIAMYHACHGRHDGLQGVIACAKGTVVQVGMGGSFPDFPLMLLIAKELNLLGSFRFVAEFALAVAWLADGVIDPLPLLSAEFASGQLAQALTFAGDKRQAAKVQLVF